MPKMAGELNMSVHVDIMKIRIQRNDEIGMWELFYDALPESHQFVGRASNPYYLNNMSKTLVEMHIINLRVAYLCSMRNMKKELKEMMD